MIILSILIPTTTERRQKREGLVAYLQNIIDLEGLENLVEIVYLEDDKTMTIGEKRERLYKMACGMYAWQIDDDDDIAIKAIPRIVDVAVEGDYDCITFEERVTIDGVESRSNFSLLYEDWADNQGGFDYVRTPFFKTPIKTDICLRVPVPHIRYGEDHAFARAIRPLLESEYHFDEQFYYYTRDSSPHNERYGITKL